MKNLLIDLVNVSEVTAIAASKWIGKNDPIAADKAAVEAMRDSFNKINFKAKVVIGEGERDEAPMLHIGEIVGNANCQVQYDLALDPLECTSRCAKNDGGSMTAIVVAEAGMLLPGPDVYMSKIASVVSDINLDLSISENLSIVSKAKGLKISDLTVAVLDRERHKDIINEIISVGAKLKLIKDGDIAAAIMSCMDNSGVDIYVGIGGAPEGVIASAAISMIGGKMEGKFLFKDEWQKKRAESMLDNPYRKFTMDEMVSINGFKGELTFIMTGVTKSELLEGVNGSTTDSICIYRNRVGNVSHRNILRSASS
jgi:fructose-1,6-bisphosphatase class II